MGTENQGGNRLTQVYAKMPIRMMHAELCMQNYTLRRYGNTNNVCIISCKHLFCTCVPFKIN